MYEKEKLIISFKKSTGHRLYSQSDIDRINCIRNAISNSKISINEIKEIISLMPCWEVKNCSIENRIKYEEYLIYNEPCWALKEPDSVCGSEECRECKVYQDYGDCVCIKEFIKKYDK